MITSTQNQQLIIKRNEQLIIADSTNLPVTKKLKAAEEAKLLDNKIREKTQVIISKLVPEILSMPATLKTKQNKTTRVCCVECGVIRIIYTEAYNKKVDKYKVWKCTKCRK